MSDENLSSAKIVVGVDGSDTAVNAALWAVPEAISRHTGLRLVHVVGEGVEPVSGSHDIDVEYAEQSLRTASAAVRNASEHVDIETEILYGSTYTALAKESAEALMVCVGTVGIGTVAQSFVGSTAASAALDCTCPVAVIRTARTPATPPSQWIVAVVDDSSDTDLVLDHAAREGTLRHLPVLALGTWCDDVGDISYTSLDRRVCAARRRHPGVDIHPMVVHTDAHAFLTDTTDLEVALVVISDADADDVATYVGPHRSSPVRHPGHSVLVVR